MSSALDGFDNSQHNQSDSHADGITRTCYQPRHILKIGTTVAVFALDLKGPSIEGIATVASCATAIDYYWVQFIDDPIVRLRFVPADWQSDPDRALQLLRTFWRSRRSNDAILEDFFPD